MMENENVYVFTPQEREFFAARIQEINAHQLSLRNAVSLVIGQQGLEGTWRIGDDGSGLQRVIENGAPSA